MKRQAKNCGPTKTSSAKRSAKLTPITAGSILVRQRPEYTDTYYRVEEVCPTFHGNGEIYYRISRCNKRGERTGVSPSHNRVSAGNAEYKVFKLAPRTKG